MAFSLFPRNERFYDLFALSASNVRLGAEQLLNVVQDFTDVEAKTKRLLEVEEHGDAITHDILAYLNESFVTPFDREDIHSLAQCLDSVLDEIEGIGSRLFLFGVDRPTEECVGLVKIIVRATEAIESAVRNLRGFKGIKDYIVQIHSLENEADQISRMLVGKLFHNGTLDVVGLIKWKEIYARLEHTADRCEDVADVIEDIWVKSG
ncbi:MAG: DUF47 domain-containing protein [Planctomycetota bacterium]